jgi:AraC-like DNA-binding protein
MTRAPAPATLPEPAFVSHQVSEASRWYLDLTPPRNAALAVVCGGYERMRPDYLVERRGFPYFALEFVAEGSGSLTVDGRTYRLEPGVAFSYGPGVAHTIRTDPRTPMRKHYVDFVGREGRDLLAATPLGRWRPVRIADPLELAEIFTALGREAQGGGEVARELCRTLLRLLLLKIRQRALSGRRAAPRSHATYLRIRRHLEEHHLRLRTVEQVANECAVTPMYVARLFSRYAHTGAYRFLLRLRMDRAAELLLEEGLQVAQAAERLGFPDAFTFSRAFKRVHGVPPSRLRDARLLAAR